MHHPSHVQGPGTRARDSLASPHNLLPLFALFLHGSPFQNDNGSWAFAGGPEASGGTAVRGAAGASEERLCISVEGKKEVAWFSLKHESLNMLI